MDDDEQEEESNVHAMGARSCEPEEILRSALSRCGEMRSRSITPFVVVLLGDEGYAPNLGRSPITPSDLAVCAYRLNLEVQDMIRQIYVTDPDD